MYLYLHLHFASKYRDNKLNRKIMELKGKTILITGGSAGIGLEAAKQFIAEGARVIITGRDQKKLDLAKKMYPSLTAIKRDASNKEAAEALYREIDQLGGIDILYNNAAIMTPYRQNWLNIPDEDYQRSFQVNVIALSRICHAFIPGMKTRKWGRIVNVTSGIQDQPELIAYSISKGAVDKFTTDTSGHLAEHGVLMNTLDPGWLRTDLGGPNAPGDVTSVLPGALIPVLTETTHGQLFRAQDYANAQE